MPLITKYKKLFLVIAFIHVALYVGSLWSNATCDSFGCFGGIVFIIPLMHIVMLLAPFGHSFEEGAGYVTTFYLIALLVDLLLLTLLLRWRDSLTAKAKQRTVPPPADTPHPPAPGSDT